ncbi:uncharacterized protein ARMOST_07948 [Armillaria ostoyae]|uniref:Uncharacterized protein n=1 Tax=Armillaria ostoyae TaxID=47428 RepID=A0A284R776_ARMOS|nr:uncharacterized protein ARMOST_07948 [Armillaria ostoyae]
MPQFGRRAQLKDRFQLKRHNSLVCPSPYVRAVLLGARHETSKKAPPSVPACASPYMNDLHTLPCHHRASVTPGVAPARSLPLR